MQRFLKRANKIYSNLIYKRNAEPDNAVNAKTLMLLVCSGTNIYALPSNSVHSTPPVFARVFNGELVIEPITDNNRPRTQKELLWRLFVVKSVISKSELINIKFIKKSCKAYQDLDLRMNGANKLHFI